YAGPGDTELCTPTGAALLTTLASSYGAQPPMTVSEIGVGAGTRDPGDRPNVLRLFAGRAAATGPDPLISPGPPVSPEPLGPVVLEHNVDDVDPRLWPRVLKALLDAGASDAWLSPILMKKGRPAHTLHVRVRPERLAPVRAVVFRETSTLGV